MNSLVGIVVPPFFTIPCVQVSGSWIFPEVPGRSVHCMMVSIQLASGRRWSWGNYLNKSPAPGSSSSSSWLLVVGAGSCVVRVQVVEVTESQRPGADKLHGYRRRGYGIRRHRFPSWKLTEERRRAPEAVPGGTFDSRPAPIYI